MRTNFKVECRKKNLIEKEYIENKKQSIGLIQIVFFKVGLFIIGHVFIRIML